MPQQTLIIHSDAKSIQPLTIYLSERGDHVQHASSVQEAQLLIKQIDPHVILLGLHRSSSSREELLSFIRQAATEAEIIFLADYPDPQMERCVREQQPDPIFLQQPFTPATIEQALLKLRAAPGSKETRNASVANKPRVRVPVRMKITFPYVILALLLALGASYLVSQVILDTIEERFVNQLIEAGKLANDWMVQEEDRLLETLRLASFTRGLPEAVAAGDAERLREMILPLAINYQEEAIEILNVEGVSILSLRHVAGTTAENYESSRGDFVFNQWPFVQKVLSRQVENDRDKYAGLAQAPWGNYLYVVGPILDEAGNEVGVMLVGKSLSTIVRQVRQDTLAHATIYDFEGQPIATSLLSYQEPELILPNETLSEILSRQEKESLTRPISVASINYSEIVGPWEVRELVEPIEDAQNKNSLGLIGVSLAETFLARPSQVTRIQVFVLTAMAFILIIGLGLYLANRITKPLLQVVEASAQVAQGNLDVQVDARGNDEVAVLAHSFNEMVSSLQEGSMYRDLLGRTVSPEVREQLRRGFASGDVRLNGQDVVATILMSDIRSFTTLSEVEDPATIMTWLNEYFGELTPVIARYDGVVSKFEGDAVLAFFGVLPRQLSAQESAFQACQAGLAMLEALERLNKRRTERGDPIFVSGIGINTGPVTAGALGGADRLQYTVIGDTVNTTHRIESLTRQFGQQNSIVISQHTLFALGDKRHGFSLEPMGSHTVKGKSEKLLAYRLTTAKVKA